ncbi:MAG TPA: CHRD domain-containing protein, partial [Bacteroidota bacterium]|nr:CHRD domain-containing protein [Bacteroidota bacterium]
MKKHLLCLVATCSWLVPAAVLGQIHFTTAIDSAQEVPAPVGAVPGKGTGSFSLNEARTELTYRVTVTGLSGSGNIAAAHFHNGPPGVAAGVVRAISFVGNTASGVWKNTDTQALTDSMVQQLLRGRIYVNIHTAANPGGEIRGQVDLSTGVGFTAQLDSAQEVPAPTGAVPGRGTGSFTLNDARTELTYTITFHGLSGNLSAAHFHNGPPGVAAGVVRAISFVGNTATGVWRNTDTQALTDSMVSQLLKGRIYVNLHTAANPGGEIRGQV